MDFSALFGMKEEAQEKEPVRNVDYTIYEEGIYVGYRYFDTFGKAVSFPFGFGLSYTDFAYSIVSSEMKEGKCSIEVKVTNTGKRAGKNVVELFVSAPRASSRSRPRSLRPSARPASSPREKVKRSKWNGTPWTWPHSMKRPLHGNLPREHICGMCARLQTR